MRSLEFVANDGQHVLRFAAITIQNLVDVERDYISNIMLS